MISSLKQPLQGSQFRRLCGLILNLPANITGTDVDQDAPTSQECVGKPSYADIVRGPHSENMDVDTSLTWLRRYQPWKVNESLPLLDVNRKRTLKSVITAITCLLYLHNWVLVVTSGFNRGVQEICLHPPDG